MPSPVKALKRWWEGDLEPPDAGGPLVYIGVRYRRHWTAKAARAVWAFLGAEWKWVAGFLLALATLTLGYLRLP